ncbi:GerMN domain-containing protein [Kineococcus sp. SYSU DK005]|uniref:GerMN domain-containing protein n=1 Tax=Kineococcus sp. SYSU DK005 TaxID=3383126 RepID=UPI003D7C737B
MRTPAALLAAALGAALLAAGCGVPTGEVRRVDAAQVPPELLETTGQPSGGSPTTGTAPGPQVYFLDTEQVLVPVAAGGEAPAGSGDGAGGADERLAALLGRLAAGPGEGERADGLASALGPEVRLRVDGLTGGTARIEVSGLSDNLAADRLPLAVGQVVLTATSAPGIGAVQLVRDGEVLEVPLPGGERTAAPLGAGDYAPLLGVPRAGAR